MCGSAGAGRHHQQEVAPFLRDAIQHGADGANLVVATGNRGVDEFLCQRLVVAADGGEPVQIVARGETCHLARRGVFQIPEPGFETIAVKAERQLATQLFLDVVAILFGLFTAERSVATGFLGFDHGQRPAVFPQQDIVTELVAFVRRAWFGHAFRQAGENVEFLEDLGGILDVPAGRGELPVDQLRAGLGLRPRHVLRLPLGVIRHTPSLSHAPAVLSGPQQWIYRGW